MAGLTRRGGALAAGCAALALAACGAATQEWVKPGAARIVRLAVLPFDNQTASLRAGGVATELIVSELLATGLVPLVEPSEVADVLRRENLEPGEPGRLPPAQRVGRLLQASHVMHGTVTEFRYKPGLSETPVVGLSARIVQVATGEVVWTATLARSGSNWLAEDGLARLTQSIARDMAQHLTGALGGDRAR
ncbi:MAG: hypothetical protein A2X52_22470 [Candidatus Rokubacteria bacterium GWC2_70_16]|nr:MAG: hypothetical protein A2X52_22470 [Candidatus Rokubacteria bacterium GWC2_70_16]OGL18023.1 MAG: hypothetical protein A3K12_03720 [Candidatus Rokubacteria bacterium RIFCSPLOWO2_12_FULL_71_19]